MAARSVGEAQRVLLWEVGRTLNGTDVLRHAACAASHVAVRDGRHEGDGRNDGRDGSG